MPDRQANYDFPGMPLSSWAETKDTIHLFLQIVGKIRMVLHPKLNHWWHVTFYLTSRGFSTGRIPYTDMDFDLEFDWIDHWFRVRTSEGKIRQFPLDGLSVADFYQQVFDSLNSLGIQTKIKAEPYLHKSKIPFAEDMEPRVYDREAVHRFWRIVSQIGSIFEEFRGRFVGKSTPVHLFWHSFDLALTRFSGRKAPPRTTGTKVDQEAYSHEVISFGFWAGDDQFPEPAFYSYTAPEPAHLTDKPLKPASAFWKDNWGSHMAILRYEDFRLAANPRETLLAFLESAYQAGATSANWPIDDLRNEYCPAFQKSSEASLNPV